LLGQYGRNLKFGISAALFADTGTLWFDGQEVSKQDFLTGYGASLDFHLPYVDLIRLTYALNEDGKGEGIIIFGVSF
jgi:hypothetical protein